MIAIQCPSADELQALAQGRLNDDQSDQLFDHVRHCDTCRAELDAVADIEDSLIASLRSPDPVAHFDGEADCRVAVAKALGALATAGDATTGTDLGHLPQRIGEYEIVRPLGRGGMGSVFLARHTKLGREVALKILASHRWADPRMRERFAAEMRAVGRLSHPNVVTAHDAREVDGTAVLVTEYIDGCDLGQLVQRIGPLSIADACEIVRVAAVALQYTSQQGFVHRDVKPSNLMLSRSGDVKLLDLGLARFQSADGQQSGVTGTGQTMGTADYVSPEQVTDSRSADVRSDIYSLGCTLFKLLTGTAPFAGPEHATVFAKMTAHVSHAPPRLADAVPEAPLALVKLVESMLAKDPARRPQSPQAVAEALAPLAGESDLRQLAARAASLAAVAPAPPSVPAPSLSSAARRLPLLRRSVPLPIALGGGLLGLLLGLLLGILITIEYPDGTTMKLRVPAGSKVTASPQAAAETPADARPAVDDPETATDPGPLQFGALPVTEEAVSREALRAAREALASSEHDRPVATAAGTWHPLPPGDSAPIEATHRSRRYGLFRLTLFGPATDGSAPGAAPSTHESPPLPGEVKPTAPRASAEVEAATAGHSLEGIWRTVSVHLRGQKQDDGGRIRVIGFHQGRFYSAIPQGIAVQGPYYQVQGERFESIDLVDQQSRGRMQGIYRFLADGRLEMTLDEDERPKGFDPDDRHELITLERLGSFPRTAEDTRRLLERTDSGTAKALALMLSMAPLPPEVKAEVEQPARAAERRTVAVNNLRILGIAFHNFYDTFNKLPASSNRLEGARRPSGTGPIQPFSWRVALLPFIDQNELYVQYRFDEPWDSEHNLTLLPKMPDVFRSPLAGDDQPAGETNYQGFAGANTALGPDEGITFAQIVDGTANTLMIVETRATVPWTKPQDLPFQKPEDARQAVPFDGQPLHYLTADGAAHSMDPIDWEKLAQLITRDGRELLRP